MRRVYKKNRQERTSKLQHMVFLDFLEDNVDFDPRQHLAKKHIAKWRDVVMKLNNVGPSRNIDTWVYILHSWRNQIKSKAKKIALDPHSGLLSSTEQRALEVFEKIAPLSNGVAITKNESLDSESIADMLDVQIKQEVESLNGDDDHDEPDEQDEDQDMDETETDVKEDSLSNGQKIPAEIKVFPTEKLDDVASSERVASERVASERVASNRVASNRVASNRVSNERPVITRVPSERLANNRLPNNRFQLKFKQPERILRPQRFLTNSTTVPLVTQRGQVQISRIRTVTSTQHRQQQQLQQQPQQHQQLPPRPMQPRSQPSLLQPASRPSNINSLINLAQGIQQSIDKWVDTNRIYNRHRMDMERQNAESMAVIASSLRTFSQAILNFSQQESNNRF